MKNISLLVHIVFLEDAKESFNFPIKNSIRTSFWLPNLQKTTFSEISFEDNEIFTCRTYNARIEIPDVDFLRDKLIEKSSFLLGNYPRIIAKGIIIEALGNVPKRFF